MRATHHLAAFTIGLLVIALAPSLPVRSAAGLMVGFAGYHLIRPRWW